MSSVLKSSVKRAEIRKHKHLERTKSVYMAKEHSSVRNLARVASQNNLSESTKLDSNFSGMDEETGASLYLLSSSTLYESPSPKRAK